MAILGLTCLMMMQTSNGFAACGHINVTVNTCTIGIDYCIDCTTHVLTINSVAQMDCTRPPSYYELTTALYKFIHDINTYNTLCPGMVLPCGYPDTPLTKVIVAECWKYDNKGPSTDTLAYIPCTEVNGNCTIVYKMCYDPPIPPNPPVVHVTIISSSHDDVDCPTTPDPSPWVLGQCYNIEPCYSFFN